jgi:predicted dehydrogenase
MLRAAIVGLGWWGQNLVNAVQGKGEIEFVLGQTRTKAKAEEFAGKKGFKLVDDYQAILADKSIDAVVLATPHSQHGDQVRQAAAAGKHIFCEKPFTLTAEDAKRAIDATRNAGVTLAVGFNRRFHPNMDELKARVQDGRMGTIHCIMGEQSAFAAYAMHTPDAGWRMQSDETPAGAMTGIGIHTLDTMIGLLGNVTDVHCMVTRRGAPHVDDTTTVLLKFANGATGTLFCSFTTAPSYRLAVYGTKGLAEIHKATLEDFRFTPVAQAHGAAATPETIAKPGFNTLEAELHAFAAAVRNKKPDTVPLDQVLHGVAAFEAVVKSAKEGKPMKVG